MVKETEVVSKFKDGDKKVVTVTEVVYTGPVTPPGERILETWRQLPPMTFDLADKILTANDGDPITPNMTIWGNTDWVEDVYTKIGDSMFFYTG